MALRQIAGNIALIGYTLILYQVLWAIFSEWFTPSELRSRGIIGYAFIQQGGMWADPCLIMPCLVWLASKYRFPWSLTLLGIALLLVCVIAYGLTKSKESDASVHDGKISRCGYAHFLFAVGAFWMLLMVYFLPLDPALSRHDLFIVSCVMTVFLPFGAVMFSKRWKLEARAINVILVELATIWGVTAIRILFLEK